MRAGKVFSYQLDNIAVSESQYNFFVKVMKIGIPKSCFLNNLSLDTSLKLDNKLFLKLPSGSSKKSQ